jgi:hypothetical protein
MKRRKPRSRSARSETRPGEQGIGGTLWAGEFSNSRYGKAGYEGYVRD